MSDVAFNDFTASMSNFSLPQLEAIRKRVDFLIARRKESPFGTLEIPASKKAFFDSVGKISFDSAAVNALREEKIPELRLF